ncbi:MAG: 16S rRNA (guanine(527)-N(7))-methyltransferase RsmG, partial [Clostridia bacterium]|nr:16S rRNA (guanine(527)-N(7))-methyltransferase RsmG [Clostridia bacterium]
GIFVAYKGEAEEEIKEAENAIKVLGGKIETVKDFILSKKSGRRNIIVIKKVSKTPSLYPRGNGKERKNPL